MNWNQYFKLKERQKRLFWIFFVILVLINLAYIKNFIKEGPDYICDKIDMACNDDVYDIMIGQIKINNKTVVNNTGLNITNASLELNDTNISIESTLGLNNTNKSMILSIDLSNTNTTDNQSNKTEIIKQKNNYLNYLWFNCNFDCNNPALSTKVAIWGYRLRYTPLFIITNFAAAYILSLMIYGYSVFRLEHKKDKKESKKEESGKKKEKKKE